MSCGAGRKHGLDSTLLWLWRRLLAIALIRPLAWEPPYNRCSPKTRQKKKTQTPKPRKTPLDQQCKI